MIVPTSLVVAEATWATVVINLVLNSGTGPHVDVPFVATAIAALIAVLVGARCLRSSGRRVRALLVAAGVGVLAVAITATLVSRLSAGAAPWWVVLGHPWDAAGTSGTAGVGAGAAWFVAAVAWARGLWLGLAAPSLRHAIRSAAVGGLVFVAVFLGRAVSHDRPFLAAGADVGWLLFVWFPLISVVIALIRQQDLERELRPGRSSRPGGAWFAILAIPMAVVAGLALLVAVVAGPAAPTIGRAIARAVVVAVDAVGDTLAWLLRQVPHGHGGKVAPVRPSCSPPSRPPTAGSPSDHSTSVPMWVSAVLAGVVAVAVLVLVIVVLRRVRWRARTGRVAPDAAPGQAVDSVFSWRHLAAQVSGLLGAAMRRAWPRRRARGDDRPRVGRRGGPDETGQETVREAYVRVLRGVRAAGHGRAPSETTGQLQQRLAILHQTPVTALAELTDLYEAVRYGDAPPAEPVATWASTRADAITLGFTNDV